MKKGTKISDSAFFIWDSVVQSTISGKFPASGGSGVVVSKGVVVWKGWSLEIVNYGRFQSKIVNYGRFQKGVVVS